MDYAQESMLLKEEKLKAIYEERKNTQWKEFNQGKNSIELLVYIQNNTNETIQLIETDFEIEDLSECDIPPYSIAVMGAQNVFDHNRLGATRPGDNIFIKKFLTYAAGGKQCRLDTHLLVKSSFGFIAPTRTPVWEHQARSTGREFLHCSSQLRDHDPQAPHSYWLDVYIGKEQPGTLVANALQADLDAIELAEQTYLDNMEHSSSAGTYPFLGMYVDLFKDAIFRSQDDADKNTTTTVFFITNETSERFELIDSNVHPRHLHPIAKSLKPKTIIYFCEKTVSNSAGTRAHKFFTFSNEKGDKVFRINTDITPGDPTHLKTWNHEAISIGATHVSCTSTLNNSLTEAPYSYLVDIRVE
ncbi:hypothetical protein [Pseudomonas sp. Sample_24]|uniref:hypothetical protein n=1 Tax=Pseudomonas sp. Sample_24 TaxID=2448268 RepID=UPI001032EEF5|nr:hypothetical protein [Pseudomonas sp. Sample_24]